MNSGTRSLYLSNAADMTYLKAMRAEDILKPTAAGLCSHIGGFHIDPTRPVERALITHGHSDHARAGHGAVLATQETLDMMRLRYGPNFAGSAQAVTYGEKLKLGSVEVSFHPAGHVLGSAQICVGANVTRGIDLGELRLVRDASKAELAGTIAICPPSALQDRWTRRFPDPVSAFASGWMRVRARARQRGVELPLVISDHADWDGLTATIDATGASEVWVTHGQEDALVHWCTSKGLAARPLDLVGYGEEDDSPAIPAGEDVEA